MHTIRRRLPGELVFSILLIAFSLFMLWQAYSISKFESFTSAGAITAYMLILERAGFVLSSYVFLVISMWLLGSRKWVLNLWVSAFSLAVVYVIFQTVFAVVLPSGSWLAGVFK